MKALTPEMGTSCEVPPETPYTLHMEMAAGPAVTLAVKGLPLTRNEGPLGACETRTVTTSVPIGDVGRITFLEWVATPSDDPSDTIAAVASPTELRTTAATVGALHAAATTAFPNASKCVTTSVRLAPTGPPVSAVPLTRASASGPGKILTDMRLELSCGTLKVVAEGLAASPT